MLNDLTMWTGSMYSLALILTGVSVGYAATVHADFLIHRNIWHGRWRIVHRGPLRWLLYPHYVHHLKAHHRHAAGHRGHLEEGLAVPVESHRDIEAKYKGAWSVHHGLRCTAHGITIRGVECFAHYLAVFLVTPQPYIAALLWLGLGPAAGIPAALMPLCAVTTQVLHRYYHMSAAARIDRAPVWLRWVVRSREFARLADEHKKHHYERRFFDDYYGVLPFGDRLLRPVLRKN
jgi:hypothetical protein